MHIPPLNKRTVDEKSRLTFTLFSHLLHDPYGDLIKKRAYPQFKCKQKEKTLISVTEINVFPFST